MRKDKSISKFTLSFLGLPREGGETSSANVLRRLVFTAARTGAEQFIRMIFGTSARRAVYETYKNEPLLPEDVAATKGHDRIAAYLGAQTKKYAIFRIKNCRIGSVSGF